MTPTLSSVLRACSDVRFRRVGEESVVVRQSAGEVLVLNGVGGRVLELIDGERTLSALAEVLIGEYESDQATVTREVLQFATELVSAGLVEEAVGRPRHA